MNKFILKHGSLVTTIILAILAWFMYRQFIVKGSSILGFAIMVAVVWAIGTAAFIVFWPRMTYAAYKKAILRNGPDGEVPVNTLYAMPMLSSASATTGSLLATGTNDLLYIGGWLDLSKGAQVLHVPDFASRYYSLQFTDPANGVNFAYVGKRATGTQAGDFIITPPGWQGLLPKGMGQIASTTRSALVFGRVFVENDADFDAAYALAEQVKLKGLTQ